MAYWTRRLENTILMVNELMTISNEFQVSKLDFTSQDREIAPTANVSRCREKTMKAQTTLHVNVVSLEST